MSPSGASKFTTVCPIPSTVPPSRTKVTVPTRFRVLDPNLHHHQPGLPTASPSMPYIDLLHPSDVVSIWYTSSSRLGTVNSLRPDKPTIVMLHPLYLNSSWLWGQMDDPRLNGAFNIIAFDTRTSGKSMSTPSGMYDTWVQAADLALCFQVASKRNLIPPRFPRRSDFSRPRGLDPSPPVSLLRTVSPPATGASCRNRICFCKLRTEIRHFVCFPLNSVLSLFRSIDLPLRQVSGNGVESDAYQRPTAHRVRNHTHICINNAR